jgi:hypothetical protein
MEIHSSHAKKDLHEVIQVFQIYEIDGYQQMKKHQLVPLLESALDVRDYIPADDSSFFIKDLEDLKTYLKHPTTRQITTSSVQFDVTDRVKNLLFYCIDCGYLVSASNYDTHTEVISDATFISNYGDLPSTRRALKLYNKDPKAPTRIDPIMTRRVERRVREVARLKDKNTLSLKAHHGEFVLHFS